MKNKTIAKSIVFLALSFFLLSSCSNYLTNSIQEISKQSNLNSQETENKNTSAKTTTTPVSSSTAPKSEVSSTSPVSSESSNVVNSETSKNPETNPTSSETENKTTSDISSNKNLSQTSKDGMNFLLSIYNDEIFYKDIETLLNIKIAKLSTKSILTQANNYKTLSTSKSDSKGKKDEASFNKTVDKIVLNQTIIDKMLNASAIIKNADNTFTINVPQVNTVIKEELSSLQSNVNSNTNQVKEKISSFSPNIKVELLNSELVTENYLTDLVRKDNEIKASTVQEITNDDNSISKVMYAIFTDKKESNITREGKIIKTYLDAKVTSIEYSIAISGGGEYVRTAKRLLKINDDNSVNVYTSSDTISVDSTISFYEEETLSTKSLPKYSGIAQIADSYGNKKYYLLNTNINALNSVDTVLSDVQENTEIILRNKIENEKETLDFILNENGKESNILVY